MIEIKDPLKAFKEFPGPILLLAGPGTGKTYQLAHRIKYLIEEKRCEPNEITVITFTNEAANSMRIKLLEKTKGKPFLPVDSQPGRISTKKRTPNFGQSVSGFKVMDSAISCHLFLF